MLYTVRGGHDGTAIRMKGGIPEDLLAFLGAGRQLEYDEEDCEAGRVRLRRPEQLRHTVFRAQTYGTPVAGRDPHSGQPGTYAVPGIDLVAACSGDYEPEGLLVWFPIEGRYGVVDTDHDFILVFGADVRWAQIAASPAAYLNAQWAFEDLPAAPTEHLEPWHHHAWQG